jgi:isopentenyl-diphosphate delta-isomerase
VRDVPGLSPWCLLQLDELDRLGATPADWPVADTALLPPAARL